MKTITYTVKKGDTLSAIARVYGTTASKIANENKIPNPNKIIVGQVLKITYEPDEPKVETPKVEEVKNEALEALKACLSDVEKLDSYKKLEAILNA